MLRVEGFAFYCESNNLRAKPITLCTRNIVQRERLVTLSWRKASAAMIGGNAGSYCGSNG